LPEDEQDDGQVALENAYYNSKGLRDNPQEAIASFEKVIRLENDQLGTSGPWAFKAMKQLTKLYLRLGQSEEMMRSYRRLLDSIAQPNCTISPNAIEKGIQSMLERVASLYQTINESQSRIEDPQALALAVYDSTLQVFHPQTGASCQNERLWFKTNLKYGQLLYQMNETNKLYQVLKDLQSVHAQEDLGSSTQSLEIYALQIQLYSRLKDHKKLRETFGKAMSVRGGIPHPRTLALIQELGGKMHMTSKEYESAEKTFFQAFKSYDEAGDPSRLRCLKYLVLASMLHASAINPFDSQEARPYRDDPEIVAMTNLVQAFHNNEIQSFERILRTSRVMDDEFIREHIEDLLRTIRKQVLRRVIQPYSRISLQAIARELNGIPVPDVESLLVGLIHEGELVGQIDRVDGVLYKTTATEDGETKSAVVQKCEAMDSLILLLTSVSNEVTNMRFKDSSGMRGGIIRDL
jgi:COP9 signalosome complex subunit 2